MSTCQSNARSMATIMLACARFDIRNGNYAKAKASIAKAREYMVKM